MIIITDRCQKSGHVQRGRQNGRHLFSKPGPFLTNSTGNGHFSWTTWQKCLPMPLELETLLLYISDFKFMMASLSQIDVSMLVKAEFSPLGPFILGWGGSNGGGFSFIFSAFFWCKCLYVLSRCYQDCTRNTLRLSIYRCKWP